MWETVASKRESQAETELMSTVSLDFDARRVKGIRVLLGETQAEFADRLSVSPDMVHRWETGKAVPMRGPTLKALLDAEALT
ncbi:hypothetical protein LCGC14_0382650 [marine sediment metagenome]|uniref:HTH cro/C1-type domain-containing protein n=1 Tax=marine sediment metagenome TaxID=412755 RepID=A0A0F9VP91_9ZZZZ